MVRLTHARLMLCSMSAECVVARTSDFDGIEEVFVPAQRSSWFEGIGFVGFEAGS